MVPPRSNFEGLLGNNTHPVFEGCATKYHLWTGDSTSCHRSPWPLSPPTSASASCSRHSVRQLRVSDISLHQYQMHQEMSHVCRVRTQASRTVRPATNIQFVEISPALMTVAASNPESRYHPRIPATPVILLGEQMNQRTNERRRNDTRRHPPQWRSPCRGMSSTPSSYRRPGVWHPQQQRRASLSLLVFQLL